MFFTSPYRAVALAAISVAPQLKINCTSIKTGITTQLNFGFAPVAIHVTNITANPGRKARNSVDTEVIGRRALGKFIERISVRFFTILCEPVMIDFWLNEKTNTPIATNATKFDTPLSTFKITPKISA